MNIEVNEREIIAEAVAKLLPPARLEAIARAIIRERCQLLTLKEAADLLRMSPKSFSALDIPVVDLTDKKHRYRLSVIEERIQRSESQPKQRRKRTVPSEQ